MDLVINYQNFYEKRIRDLGTFKYELRSIEKYADIFDKIFLIYDGDDEMLPDWLNRNSVTLVKHSEFVDADILPTFNQHTIECYMHKIPELSEQFVYIKEDTFFIKTNTKEDYFVENKSVMNLLDKPEYDDEKLLECESFFSELTRYLSYRRGIPDEEIPIYIPEKVASPMFKALNEKILGKYEKRLRKGNDLIEKDCDFCYEMYLTGEFHAGLTIEGNNKKLIDLKNISQNELTDILNNTDAKVIYTNEKRIDNEEQFNMCKNTIINFLSSKFTDKSRFEK